MEVTFLFQSVGRFVSNSRIGKKLSQNFQKGRSSDKKLLDFVSDIKTTVKIWNLYALLKKYIHTHNCFMAVWIFSRTTRVSRYQKKHSPTHTYHGHQSSLICFLHLFRSMASFLFNLHAWQSFAQSLSKFSLVYKTALFDLNVFPFTGTYCESGLALNSDF